MRKGKIVVLDRIKSTEHDQVTRALAAGQMERVHDGIYTDLPNPSLQQDVYQSHVEILARLIPGAVLYGVSGIKGGPVREQGKDGRPTYPGWLYTTHGPESGSAVKRPSLAGLEIRSTPGPGALEGDTSAMGIVFPSKARQALENLAPSRARGGPARTLGREGMELRLVQQADLYGAAWLDELLQLARRIAPAMKAEQELSALTEIVDGILAKREMAFSSEVLRSRFRKNDPYDQGCLKTLAALAGELKSVPEDRVDDPHVDHDSRECVSFIEAYFSNYIEGTKFLIEKARRIVFDGDIPNDRTKDASDVLATYRQVVALARQSASLGGNGNEQSFDEFEDELRHRHRLLMAARPEVSPGVFKTDPNRAGNHVFVMPDLVRGTLREGHAMMAEVDTPWKRGLFLHCLSVLVHPFDDGNGRLSRIMMNRELVGGGSCRIVVPAVFRNDYIGAMRALTRPDGVSPGPFIRAMTFCRDVTASIAPSDLDLTIDRWAATNAFLEDEREARLEMPSEDTQVEWRNGIPAPAQYWAVLDRAQEMSSVIPRF